MAYPTEVVRTLMRRAARAEFAPSPLYRRLAEAAAQDDALLAIAARHRSPTMMLFAAVHWLLLGGALAPGLARYYPSVSGALPADPADAYDAFRGFVLAHEDEILRVMASRIVNKMEVRRCAGLRALVAEAAARLRADAVHLVDVGCSAGANLLLDRWRVRYGGEAAGAADAPLELPVELRGAGVPAAALPRILRRAGIDFRRVDPADPDEQRWIVAQLLPEETGAHALARKALAALQESPPEIHVGDAVAALPRIVAGFPPGEPVVFMHSAVVAYMGADVRRALQQSLRVAAAGRPSARVYLEADGEGAMLGLALPAWSGGKRMGAADLDCRWMRWDPA
jgi:hypothetical protein